MNKFFVYNNNDLVPKTYTISNKGSKQTNVKVIFTLPSGVAISRVTTSKGSYSNKVWSVGELVENEIVNIVVIYTVTNVNLAPFEIEAQVESTEGGLFCENYIYIEKSLTPCEDCNKAYPIFPAFSALNGSYTAKTLNFLDNNISFSTTIDGTQSQIFAYYKPGEIHAGTNYIELGNVKLENSNGVTFGLNGSILTASHNGLLTQSPQAASASNSSLTFHTLQFGNTLGLSHYISNGSVLISSSIINSLSVLGNTTAQSSSNTYNNLVISANGILSAGMSGNTLVLSATAPSATSLSFVDSNGITFGINNSTLTASHNGLTSQSNQVVSAANGSITFQTLSLANLNGFSFYTTNNSIAGSYTVPTAAAYSIQVPGSTYTNSVQFNDANGVSFAGGVGGISASIATQIVTNVSNSNNVSLGIAAGLLTASVNSQTNQTLGLYALGNTTHNSSTTVDARTLSIRGLGDIYVGYSAGTLEISRSTVDNYLSYYPERPLDASFQNYSTARMSVFPMQLNSPLSFNMLKLQKSNVSFEVMSNIATNFLYVLSHQNDIQLGIYTKNVSTLSLLSSFFNREVISADLLNTAGGNSVWVTHSNLYGEGTNSSVNSFSNSVAVTANSNNTISFNNTIYYGVKNLNFVNGSYSLSKGEYYLILNVLTKIATGIDNGANATFTLSNQQNYKLHYLNLSTLTNRLDNYKTASMNNFGLNGTFSSNGSLPSSIAISSISTVNTLSIPNIIMFNQ